jgi:hypothetical protein
MVDDIPEEAARDRLPHPKIFLFLTSACHLIDRFQEKEASDVGVFLQTDSSFCEGRSPREQTGGYDFP